jgi:hypothetical protein
MALESKDEYCVGTFEIVPPIRLSHWVADSAMRLCNVCIRISFAPFAHGLQPGLSKANRYSSRSFYAFSSVTQNSI